jgi:hypothetical protein
MGEPSLPEIRIEIVDPDPHIALRDARTLCEELTGAGAEAQLQRSAIASAELDAKGAPATDIIALTFSGMNLSLAAAQFWRMRRPGRRLSITRGDDVLEISGERVEDTKDIIERFLQMDPSPPAALPPAGDPPAVRGPSNAGGDS